MATKKKQFRFSPWDSICKFAGERYKDPYGIERAETYTTMGESIRFTESWHKLNYRQRDLYGVCKCQIKGKRKPRNDYDNELFKPEEVFYLTFAEVLRYGIYTESQAMNFSRDMAVLEKYGFIDCLSHGRGKVKSIYKLSTRFKTMEF